MRPALTVPVPAEDNPIDPMSWKAKSPTAAAAFCSEDMFSRASPVVDLRSPVKGFTTWLRESTYRLALEYGSPSSPPYRLPWIWPDLMSDRPSKFWVARSASSGVPSGAFRRRISASWVCALDLSCGVSARASERETSDDGFTPSSKNR